MIDRKAAGTDGQISAINFPHVGSNVAPEPANQLRVKSNLLNDLK